MTSIEPEILLAAYREGYFPMSDPRSGDIDWYNPDPRCILPLDGLRVSESLSRRVRSGRFEIMANTAFEEVMRACAAPRASGSETWIDDRFIQAYGDLHRRGLAHSVEAWREGVLVGGLYGVLLGGVFMGESMFSLPEQGGTDASKVCLVWLVAHLNRIGATVLDVQFISDHMERMGAIEVPRDRYLGLLQAHRSDPVAWGRWPGLDDVLSTS
ncbi:MAG: leucyl/phenylalanyl-tRNA--protein transferase [Phycisphaerae bacterium]|nr:leucyl/phenylalanyl-tRNA--protein transferase [Phycisphaerae bacterium]|tara:strand:+ start:265 stop:903 length:639 start_codon:yes stop_codon:yes gene_type:complete